MNKGVYVATIERNSGKSVVILGLMRMLLGQTAKVAYFRPIVEDMPNAEIDPRVQTVLSFFELDMAVEDASVCSRSEVLLAHNQGKAGEVLDQIIQRYKKLEEAYDFVLVEGTDFSDEGSIIEFDFNVLIAKNIGVPVLIVSSGEGKNSEDLCGNLKLAYDTFQRKEVDVLAVVANRVATRNVSDVKSSLLQKFKNEIEIVIIPVIKSLAKPTIREIAKHLKGKVLFGADAIDNQAGSYGVGAMQLRNYLTHFKKDSLVITPGDRADIILGVLQANLSANYPKISGIILTGGLVPEKPIMKLIEGLTEVVPIISVKEGTFGTTNNVGNIRSKIYPGNTQKINTAIATFEKYVDVDRLAQRLVQFKSAVVTPKMFQYMLLKRAQEQKKHIVLPEGDDERIIRAASRLLAVGVVDITLLGAPAKIKAKAKKLGVPLDLKRIQIIQPLKSPYFMEYATTLYELRKHKNVNMDMAKDMMADVSYFGTMMIYKGHADGMVSGAVHTTQHTIRPALQFIKTKPDVAVVSSIFFMCLKDRVSVFGDCAINPNPNAAQLASIAIDSAASAKSFGIEPRVAMLSYSSGTSGKGEDVDRVREATSIVKEKEPTLKVEGPIQYDAAVDLKVGQSKLPDSAVAGQATVLIFPDLNTGNNTYKAVQRETGALAIGPMLQGLNKPVNDLSRGCTVNDIYNTVIITAIQAQTL